MIKVDIIVKNKVSEEQFENIVEEWLSGGDYTPDDIIENLISERNAKLLPAHFYKARFSGTVSANLGYDRREYYTVYNSQTKKHETKSRTVTDWRPFSQQVQGEVNACEYAGDKTFINLANFIDGTGWNQNDIIIPDQAASIDKKITNLFALDHNQTWNDRALKRCYNKANTKARAGLPPSDWVRGFNSNLVFDVYSIKSVILPFWIYTYEYQNKVYFVVVDGNNPARITGERPINKKRRNTVFALRWIGWPSGIYLSFKLADTYANGPNYDYEWGFLKTIGLFLLGFVITWTIVESIVGFIKNNSKKKRMEKLREKQKNKLQKA